MSIGRDRPSSKTVSSLVICFVLLAIAIRCVRCPFDDGCDRTTSTNSNCSFSEFLVTEKSQKMNQSANSSVPLINSFDFEPVRKNHRKKLYVGYLTAAKGDLKERQGLLISGAMTLALKEINENPNLLPNVELVLKWNDTLGDTVKATKAMIDMICHGVSVFFGPEGSCFVEATVALAENIPMISYKCADYKASEIPIFAKTEPPNTQVTKYVISLLRYYRWYQFSIIYEDSWSTVAQAISETATNRNMTVTVFEKVKDPHVCCEEKLSCCQSSYWYQFIDQTKNKTRIYVFLGTKMLLIDMMNAMQNTELFKNGEYMVIYVDMNVYSLKEAFHYLKKTSTSDVYTTCHQEKDFIKRAKSLLVIASTAPTDNYEIFTDKVRKYNREAPFFYQTSDILNRLKYQKFVSIYAAYLYDSVMLYAWALDQLLRDQQQTITDEQIEIISKNGTKIIETVIRNRSYQSITGATIKFDKCGDSEGNFSVLAFKKANAKIMNYTCDYSMVPVAQFQQSDFPEYRLNSLLLPIDWPAGQKPNDAPACGFNNELCPKDNSLVNSIVVASVLGFMLFCSSFVIVSVYRKWKIEQEIEGLLWKIDPCELQNYMGSNMFLSSSKASLMSASFYSYETQIKAQVFAYIAEYRGVIVRIKELKLSRKRDISRETKKEMRLLREMKHDNINAFIGAIVEPSRLLLITDYCAKGSLYDIIENEDIKLDDMFIFSLVHDLVKGMIYIHRSAIVCHGNLKSSNCVVTSRWLLQVSDFGLNELRQCPDETSLNDHRQFQNLLWKAPELLRDPSAMLKGSQKGDVYSFAIILYELIGRRGPFGNISNDAKEIVELVKHCRDPDRPFRPDINWLRDVENSSNCSEFMISCMTDCWSESADSRPDFVSIRAKLKKSRGETHQSIMDQMMEMMEKYANNLEDLVNERTRLLHEEKKKSEDLLHRILPEPVADRLTKGLAVEPEHFDSVTIYFSDIVGFTALSAESTPLEVVNFLNDLYTVFDRIIKGFDVYKVETIGDAYMVVSGLPIRNNNAHVGEIASMALEILAAVNKYVIAHRPNRPLMLRIGIHTGPVVAGIVGLTMPRYCLFGDTVNTASRMESNGEPLKIHISEECKLALDQIGGYVTQERGLLDIKGKGEVKTFWLMGATSKAVKKRLLDNDTTSVICYLNPKLTDDSRQTSFCEKSSRKLFQQNYSRHANVNGDSLSTLQDYSNFITQNNNNYLHPNHHHYHPHHHHQNQQQQPPIPIHRNASLITVNSEELPGPKSSTDSRKSSLSNQFRIRNCKSLDFKHCGGQDDDDDDGGGGGDNDKKSYEKQQLLRNGLLAAGFVAKAATAALKSSNSNDQFAMKPLLSRCDDNDNDDDVNGDNYNVVDTWAYGTSTKSKLNSRRRRTGNASRCQSLELIPGKVQWRLPNESVLRSHQATKNMLASLFDVNADRRTISVQDRAKSNLNIKIDL